MDDEQRELYVNCLQKQIDEIDMLSSIFCNPGEIQIYDPSVIADFNEFINDKSISYPKSQLNFSIYIKNDVRDKIEIQVSLPYLYPLLENAAVNIRTSFPSKTKELLVKNEIENYINSEEVDKTESYIYQIITWIQDSLEQFLSNTPGELQIANDISNLQLNEKQVIELERLWILSHHIKSKTKRQEIVKNARDLNLSGFCKPGKPGLICVEGLKENTQEFWKIIRSWNWQKIQIKLNEIKKKDPNEIEKFRRFNGFKEQLFTETEDEGFAPMNMGLLMKFLEAHNSGYIKKDLFGFD